MLLVGEDFVLHGQIHASAVHEVHNGQTIFDGDFLSTQVFLACDGEPGTGFDRGVIRHCDAWFPMNPSDFNNHTA